MSSCSPVCALNNFPALTSSMATTADVKNHLKDVGVPKVNNKVKILIAQDVPGHDPSQGT